METLTYRGMVPGGNRGLRRYDAWVRSSMPINSAQFVGIRSVQVGPGAHAVVKRGTFHVTEQKRRRCGVPTIGPGIYSTICPHGEACRGRSYHLRLERRRAVRQALIEAGIAAQARRAKREAQHRVTVRFLAHRRTIREQTWQKLSTSYVRRHFSRFYTCQVTNLRDNWDLLEAQVGTCLWCGPLATVRISEICCARHIGEL